MALHTPTEAPSSRRWLTLVVVAIAQLMVVLDATIVNIALPAAQADLKFSDGDRQWVVTAYSLAFASLLLIGGRVSDLIGRKRTFIIGQVGFAAASLAGGLAQSFGMLIAARAAQGVFGALLAPTALAVLTTTFTIPAERAKAFGVFGAIAGMGGAIGLLLGGVLTEYFSWRWNLTINVFIAIVAIIGTVLHVPDGRLDGPRPKIDVPGAALVAGGLFGIVYGFSRAESHGWGSASTWGTLTAAAVLLAVFVWRQARTSHPLLPLTILRDRNRAAAYTSVLISGAGMFGVFLFLTYYLQTILGYTAMRTGVGFLPMIVGIISAAQLSTNVLLPKLGPKILVPAGMLIAATGMLLLTRLGTHSSYWPDVLAPLLVLGLGMGTIMPPSMQTATLGVDRHHAGVASALVSTSQQVGGSISTALLNTVATSAVASYILAHASAGPAVAAQAAVHGYATAYRWCAILFAIGAVITALAFGRRKVATVVDVEHDLDDDPDLDLEPMVAV